MSEHTYERAVVRKQLAAQLEHRCIKFPSVYKVGPLYRRNQLEEHPTGLIAWIFIVTLTCSA